MTAPTAVAFRPRRPSRRAGVRAVDDDRVPPGEARSKPLLDAGRELNSLICPSDTQNQSIPFPATQEAGAGVSPGWGFNELPSLFPLPAGNFSQAFTS